MFPDQMRNGQKPTKKSAAFAAVFGELSARISMNTAIALQLRIFSRQYHVSKIHSEST